MASNSMDPPSGIDLTFVKEQQQLGTGGALWNARDHLEDEFILLWGDDYHPIQYALGQSPSRSILETDHDRYNRTSRQKSPT